jgi:hypothetical protein
LTIKASVDNGAAIPVDASKEVLLEYHYALHRQSKQLEKERREKRRRRESVSTASKAIHKHAVIRDKEKAGISEHDNQSSWKKKEET